jgi:hypothetical protein
MPTPPSPEEEQRRLRAFLDDLESTLQSVVDHPLNILPGSEIDRLRAAWYEVRPSFDSVRIQIGAQNQVGLNRVGLTGAPLYFELGVFDRQRTKLLDHAPEIFVSQFAPVLRSEPFFLAQPGAPSSFAVFVPNPITTPVKKAGFWRRLGRRLGKCLKAADVIVGSLAVVFPPAEGIHQMKEAVELAVENRRK